MPSKKVFSLAESWSLFINNVQPRRLIREDPGVRGPLWLFSKPTSPYHVYANVLRLSFAILLAPIFLIVPVLNPSGAIRRLLWSIEWAKSPNAVLLEAPGSLIHEEANIGVPSQGQYAVTGNKPRWLLEVEFCGTEIVSQKQVRYDWEGEKGATNSNGLESKSIPNDPSLRKRIRQSGYIAISYAMRSAEQLFLEFGRSLEPKPGIHSDGKRKYDLADRQTISQTLLDEYARARKTVGGKQDGIEFIWLDEFCLSADGTHGEEEISKPREAELGQLADIFRGARSVIVFCHVEDCDHTGVKCPWANRLFTMGEILYTPEVLQMTRTKVSDDQKLSSSITVIPGSEFRSDMQACAAKAKQWHLYNIMQHATNSGAVPWQSAIHSLVVEAIRRDEADNFHAHRFLGKALNGLLPRRSQLEDLQGINGWADLAWLLELNQAYYNPALLAAVCKLADDDVEEYRWWGKPILPKEGSERLEALVHAIPVMFPETDDHPKEPALSIVAPKSIALTQYLQRDPIGLYRNAEMRSLMWFIIGINLPVIISYLVMLIRGSTEVGLILAYVDSIVFSIIQLLAGTIFVEKSTWVVIEDHTIEGRDAYRWLQSQDPTYGKAIEWGSRQLVPEWDTPKWDPSPGSPPSPYAITLIDLRSGVFTRAAVTKPPNDIVVLAVHGSGVTCMLLDRNQDVEEEAATAVKVGMANFPPFVLAQAEDSGTVHIGSRIKDTNNQDMRKKLAIFAFLSSFFAAGSHLVNQDMW